MVRSVLQTISVPLVGLSRLARGMNSGTNG
jgi:hypothetical protein